MNSSIGGIFDYSATPNKSGYIECKGRFGVKLIPIIYCIGLILYGNGGAEHIEGAHLFNKMFDSLSKGSC